MALEQARIVATVLKDPATAAEIVCSIPNVRAARLRTGRPCADDFEPAQETACQAYEGDDPVVRRRVCGE